MRYRVYIVDERRWYVTDFTSIQSGKAVVFVKEAGLAKRFPNFMAALRCRSFLECYGYREIRIEQAGEGKCSSSPTHIRSGRLKKS